MWNLLRHYQAEKIGFYKTNLALGSSKTWPNGYVPKVIPDIPFTELYIGPNKTVDMKLIQRGTWSKDNFMEYIPVKLEEYTYFTLKTYFFMFWSILIVQTITIIMVKALTSKKFKNWQWHKKIFHVMECSNFAFPMHDWDHDDGDGQQHYLRMQECKKEVQINLLINTLFNLVLLSPLPLLYM